MSNKKLTMALVVVAILTIGSYFRPVDVQFGANPGPSHTEGQEFFGGSTFANVNATTSSSVSYTLVPGDLAPNGFFYDTIIFTLSGVPGGGALNATTTWTLPASSTMQNVLSQRGARASVCFSVATSSGGSLVLAEGTGFGLETASSTLDTAVLGGGAGSRTIYGGTTACGWVVRGINNNNAAGHTGTQDLNLILTPTMEAQ